MMTMADTIAALRAAIDAGDDSALPILADAMEEAGEGRLAAGLRHVRDSCYRPYGSQGGWSWYYTDPGESRRGPPGWPPLHGYEVDLWGLARRWMWGWSPHYPTRSAAFLALAEALAGE